MPSSQCFFPNAEQLIGEESRLIALRQERIPGFKVDVHCHHDKMLHYWQYADVLKSILLF